MADATIAGDASPDGGAAGLAITGQPRNKTVVEGTTAVFDVVAVGVNLTYQWQRAALGAAAFVDVAGATSARLLLEQVPLGENRSRYRVQVSSGAGGVTSAEVTLNVVAAGAAARVYVTDRLGVTTYDHAMAVLDTPTWAATANLGTGTFSSRSVSTDGSLSQSFAGLFQIKLINNTGGPVTIAAGAFRVHLEGDYTHLVRPGQSSSGQISTQLSVAGAAGGVHTARGDHQVGFRYDPDGAVLATTNSARKIYEVNGATVDIATATPTRLVMDLVMPELVVAAGATMSFGFQIETVAIGATADFMTRPAALTLTLPPGITLDHDGAVPLAWVITPP